MRYAPDSRLGKVDLAWVSLCIIDDLRNSLGGERCVREHDLRLPGDASNWRDIADEIEIELSIDAGIVCVRRPHQKVRIAIRGRIHASLGSDIGAGARSIFFNKWLAKTLRQP